MADANLLNLMMKLYQKTTEGKVKWERTAKEDVYISSFPEYSIQLGKIGGGLIPTLYLSIFDSNGLQVESYQKPPLGDDVASKYLTNLYEIARRNAMGADKAIIDILKNLDK
jgi:hypothetical protein